MGYPFVDEAPTVEQHHALAAAVGWEGSFRWEAMGACLQDPCAEWSRWAPTTRPSRWAGWSATGRPTSTSRTSPSTPTTDTRPRPRGAAATAGPGRGAGQGDCFVGLFSTPEAVELYRGAGFGTETMTGMWQVLRPR